MSTVGVKWSDFELSNQTPLPSRNVDKRAYSLGWKEKTGQYGTYESINVENVEGGGQWFLDLFDKADDKGYVYDQQGVYKYKRNGNWINRFRKSKADGILEEAAAGGYSVPVATAAATATQQQFNRPPADTPISGNAWAERDAKKSEQIQKLHDETLEATQKQTEAIVQNTVSNFTIAEKIENLTRQVEDLCFILTEGNKAKGARVET